MKKEHGVTLWRSVLYILTIKILTVLLRTYNYPDNTFWYIWTRKIFIFLNFLWIKLLFQMNSKKFLSNSQQRTSQKKIFFNCLWVLLEYYLKVISISLRTHKNQKKIIFWIWKTTHIIYTLVTYNIHIRNFLGFL